MSKYSKLIDKIRWSFSTLNLYETCPHAFYLKKICEIKGVDNDYATIGKFAHEINSSIFAEELTLEQALEKWVDEFDNYHYSISKNSANKKLEAFCDYLIDFNTKYKDRYEVLGNELKVNWAIDKYEFIGFIDLILQDKETDDLILIDHKSASSFLGKKGQVLKSQEHNLNTYKHQMYLYCIPIYEMYKKYPKYIVWNHIFDNTTTKILFDLEEFEKTKQWALEVINKTFNDTEYKDEQQYMMCNVLCNFRNGDCIYKNIKGEE